MIINMNVGMLSERTGVSIAKTSNREFALDFIRCICCILVVLLHTPSFCSIEMKVLYRSVTAVAVPCFMAISGYLLFYRIEYNYKNLIKSIIRYAVIFLIWSTLYNIYYYKIK